MVARLGTADETRGTGGARLEGPGARGITRRLFLNGSLEATLAARNARKVHANGTDYTCATWSVVRPRDPFPLKLFQDLGVVQGIAADGTPRIDPLLVGPGPDNNTLVDGTWYPGPMYGGDPAEAI